jgi:DNA replication protein DnaC
VSPPIRAHPPADSFTPAGWIPSVPRPRLLVLDEAGYLALDTTQASLLFQVLCERYERRQPVVLTSNKAFADWAHVFAGDAVMASAALDRLLHRSTVVHIRGDTYRLKQKRQAGAEAALTPG